MTIAIPCRPIRVVACLFAALFTLGSCGQKSASLPRLDAQAVVLAFGDSLTYGTGAPPDESYPMHLERAIKRRVVPLGVPGEVSDGGRMRLEAVLEEVKPALLLLCHGGNDILQKRDEAALANNLRTMIQAARNRKIAVVLIGVPKPGLWLSTASVYETVAKDMNIPLEGKALASILGDNRLKADHVHPNSQGYAKLAGEIAKLLKERGAI
jgi:acyl-CoA thioesterase I